MARYNSDTGLYLTDEFKNRGVVKLAPDAVVEFNNGLETLVQTPVASNSGNIKSQEGISSINITNTVDPPGSSTATVEIFTPIDKDNSKYWITIPGSKTRMPYFVPMMEIKVYFRGRFLVGGKPRYYQAFWGYVSTVEESFNGGIYKITLQCSDMLHWWSRIQVAFHPSVESNAAVKGKQGLTYWGSRYATMNAYEIIYTLMTEMGYENFVPPNWLGKQGTAVEGGPLDPRWFKMYSDILSNYWMKRFKDQASYLKMYGARGELIKDPHERSAIYYKLKPTRDKKADGKSQESYWQQQTESFNMTGIVQDFPIFGEFENIKSLEDAEYKNKLEIATEVKTRVEYEFFQDTDGTFVFKPPYYNMNTSNLLPYRINPQDIISFSAGINSEEIVTAVQATVSLHKQMLQTDQANYVGYYVDVDMVKRYGYIFRAFEAWWISTPDLVNSYAAGMVGLINAKASTASVVIAGRPELKLGYPVYIPHKDCFYYVKSMTHTFDYGGSYTTSLGLEAGRKKEYDGDGKIRISAIYRKKSLNTEALKKKLYPESILADAKNKAQTNSTESVNKIEELERQSGIIQDMAGGVYEIIPNSEDAKYRSIRMDSIPFTDAWGYKVVGAFDYGRSIMIRNDQAIDVKDDAKKFNDTAIANKFTAQTVASMSVAVKESNDMDIYFSNVLKREEEGPIPSYRDPITGMSDLEAAKRMIHSDIQGGSPDVQLV